jgi:phospholipid/cholesterol/gamma-HCH transport system ATP-binding protein
MSHRETLDLVDCMLGSHHISSYTFAFGPAYTIIMTSAPTASADTFVQIRNLCFKRNNRTIFDHINMDIAHGKITAVMGPSGTGKTTLLRLISGLLKPHSGQVLVKNTNIHKLSRAKLYQARRQISMLFQSGALFTNLNVFENVVFPLREHTNLPEDMLHDIALMKLEAVGLRGARNLMTSQLSGGMARRVAMARALALDPELMLYDEPFTGQDPIAMGVLVKLIKQLNSALGLTSVIVSHDVAETASIADYIYVISNGKVIGEGTPETLFAEKSPAVHQFIHGLPDGVVPFHYPAVPYAEDLLS